EEFKAKRSRMGSALQGRLRGERTAVFAEAGLPAAPADRAGIAGGARDLLALLFEGAFGGGGEVGVALAGTHGETRPADLDPDRMLAVVRFPERRKAEAIVGAGVGRDGGGGGQPGRGGDR